MTEQKQRLDWVDAAKGSAMITVVLYHVILGFEKSGLIQSTELVRYAEVYLTAIATPVFFLLSGYFIERSIKKAGYRKFIRSIVHYILYPYILWAIIQMGIKILFASFVNKTEVFDLLRLIHDPPAQFWFLHALFFAQLLFCLLHKYYRNNYIIAIWVLLIASILANPVHLIADILRSLAFLLIGLQFARTGFLMRSADVKTLTYADIALLLTGPIYVLWALPAGFEGQSNFIGGVAATIILCAVLFQYGSPKILQIIGKYSMYIFVMHIMAIVPFRVVILKLGLDIPLLSIALCTLAGVFLPIIAAAIMEKIKISKYIGIKSVNYFQKRTA